MINLDVKKTFSSNRVLGARNLNNKEDKLDVLAMFTAFTTNYLMNHQRIIIESLHQCNKSNIVQKKTAQDVRHEPAAMHQQAHRHKALPA